MTTIDLAPVYYFSLDKPLDAVCNPAEGKCRDQRSHCAKDHTNTVYRCVCHKGFKKVNGLCKGKI